MLRTCRRTLPLLGAASTVWLVWSLTILRGAEPLPSQFRPPVAFGTGETSPTDIDVSDYNNDGISDVAILTRFDQFGVNVLLGNGIGGLVKSTTLLVPHASGFSSGDFNRDGVRDLVVTQSSGKVAVDGFCPDLRPGAIVFVGRGAGNFSFQTCLPAASSNQYLTDAAVGDFSGDNIVDLAVADGGFFGLTVYRGVGDGTFRAGTRAVTTAGTNLSNVPIAAPLIPTDVNRDGRLDLVVRSSQNVATFFGIPGDTTGRMVFTSTPALSWDLSSHLGVQWFASGDFNNDGVPDIAGVERGTLPATPTTPGNFLFVSLGTGTGAYTSSDTHPFPETLPNIVSVQSTVVADFNRDGRRDVVAVHDSGNAVQLFAGYGNGKVAPAQIVSVGVQPRLVAAADWNQDLWPDIAVADWNGGQESRTWILEQVPGVLDEVPPTVALTSPAPDSVLSGMVELTASATDDVGVAAVEFYRGTTLLGADATEPYAVSWDTTGVPNGTHALIARASDAFGNIGSSATVQVSIDNVDTTPPAVSLTSPAAGSLLKGMVSLASSATDSVGVTKVEFYRNGVLIGADTTPPSPFVALWNTDALASGLYELTARAYDAANNVGISAPVGVVVDRPPTANAGLDRTWEATSASGASVQLTGIGSDPDGDLLSYSWNEGAAPIATLASPTVQVPIGIYVYQLTVTDPYGASAVDSVQITVADTTGPALSLPSSVIAEATSPSGAIVTFEGTATDLVDGPRPVTCAPASGTTFAIGPTAVTCSASDRASHTATGTFTVTVRDTTSPSISITAPAAGSTVSGIVPVSAIATDTLGVARVEFFANSQALGVDTSSPYSVNWDTSQLSGGTPVTLSARAYDGAGNMGTSASVNVTVASSSSDTTRPTVSITAPADGSKVTGLVTVAASATDNRGVARVEFFAGTQSLGIDTSAPYNVTWNTSAVASGTVVALTARAADAAGNTRTSSAVTVTVAHSGTTQPVFNSSTNLPGEILALRQATYQFLAGGATPMTWSLDVASPGMAIDAATGFWSWAPTVAQIGRHTVVVRVTNAGGTATFTDRIDVKEPEN